MLPERHSYLNSLQSSLNFILSPFLRHNRASYALLLICASYPMMCEASISDSNTVWEGPVMNR